MAAALAMLTRYVGIAAIATGATALLVLGRGGSGLTSSSMLGSAWNSFRKRMLTALGFLVIACVPVVLLAIWNRVVTGGATDRRFVFHQIKLSQLVTTFSTVAQWFAVGKVRSDLRAIAFAAQVILLAGLALYFLIGSRHRDRGRETYWSRLPELLALYCCFHFAVLIFTATLVDVDTVFDSRSLLPVHVAALILVLALAYRLFVHARPTAARRIAFPLLALLLLASSAVRGFSWLRVAQADGQWYTSRAWQQSPTIVRVQQLPAGIPIYSNGFDAIYYLTGRPALTIPEKILHNAGQINPDYDAQFETMKRDLLERGGVIVYFNTLPERAYFPTSGELLERLPQLQIEQTSDAQIISAR